MPRVLLSGGAYKAAGLIAAAQRSVNLYAEKNPDEAQPGAPVTHYPRPGLTPLGTPSSPGAGRCLYTATNGDLYAVVNQDVYYIDPDWAFHLLGQLFTPLTTPVSMADNGTDIVVVDGSSSGNDINMAARMMNIIGDANFMGATRVDFLDGFLILNEPNSPNWYSTTLYAIVFNALYFGTKTAWPDNIQTIIAVEREVWVLGKYKSEVWYNSGTVPFPFQAQPGIIVEHGCVAPYSAAKQDVNLFWLSQSPEGARMVMINNGHTAMRISTHAIEEEFLTYARVDDAIGVTYQIRGHGFYVLHFPTVDRTWTYDLSTKQWHEPAYYDFNGVQHRTKNMFCAYAYGKNITLDWNSGQIYQIDETNFTDNGAPLVCIRSMPHLLDGEDFNRITCWKVIADMETGAGTGTVNVATQATPWSFGFNAGFGPISYIDPPMVSLRMSRDRGFSFGNPVMKPMGAAGLYNTTPTWNRLGYFRDMIVELSWSTPQKTALNGVFIEIEKHEADT